MQFVNRPRGGDGAEAPRVHTETNNNTDENAADVLRRIAHICIGSLANFPFLQSSTNELTRDQDLFDLVYDSEDETFFFLAAAYLQYVRRRTLHMNSTNLTRLLEKFEGFALAYNYSCQEGLRLLAVSMLRSTIHFWTSSSDEELKEKIHDLCDWLCGIFDNRHLLSWRVADSMVTFLDDYLQAEPSEVAWSSDGDTKRPHELLHELVGDTDIRVRLRAAVASAKSFNAIHALQIEAKDWYKSISKHLSANIDEWVLSFSIITFANTSHSRFSFEEILSRLICLGNIILVNSSVRRGAYWHFLELCLHTTAFNRQLEVVHCAVAERMGLTLSSLFGAHASQVAFSIRQQESYDFLKLPPHLLGYHDMKDCALLNFQAFSATNLLFNGDDVRVEHHGRRLFKNHCRILKKTLDQGIRDNLAEIVGQQIAFWMHSKGDSPDLVTESLEMHLEALLGELGREVPYTQHLRPYADGIVASIIRTMGDQDYSESGPICHSLKDVAGASTEVFVALTKFRTGSGVKQTCGHTPLSRTIFLSSQDVPSVIRPSQTLPQY